MWLRRLTIWFGLEKSLSTARRVYQRGKHVPLRCERLEDRLVPTTTIWTGAADHSSWTLAGNWNNGVPTAGETVLIPNLGVNGTTAVIYNSSAAASIGSLTTSLPVVIEGGGTIETTSGGVTLNFNATITIDSGSTLSFSTLSQSLSGFGSVVNDGTLQAVGGSTLTLGSPVSGSSPSSQGTITTDTGNNSVVFQNGVTIADNTIAGLLVPDSGGNDVLKNMTVASTGVIDMTGDFSFSNGSNEERVIDGLTLDGAINLDNSAILGFGEFGAGTTSQTLTGSGTMDFVGAVGGSTLSVDGGTKLVVDTGVTIDGKSGTIEQGAFDSSTNDSLTLGGTLAANVSGGTIGMTSLASFTNNGTINVGAGSTVNLNPTTFTNFSSNTLTGGTYVVAGTFEFPAADVVTNAASITLSGASSAILNNQNASNALLGFASNSAGASFTLANGSTLSTSAPSFSNAGSVTIDATGGTGTSFTVQGGYDQTAGTTTLTGGGALDSNLLMAAFSGGTLQGSGSITGNVSVGGTVSPGTSTTPGTISITGNVTFNSGATYIEKINGSLAGSGFDQLVVSGSETFSSGVNLSGSLASGFSPSAGMAFLIHSTAGTVSGTFAQGNSVVIGGTMFGITYASGLGVTLTAASPTTVYVDAIWAGTPAGADPADDPIGGLNFGFNAFSDIQSGINQVASGGTVVVFGESYASPVVVNKSLSEIQTALNADTPGQTLVAINGAVSLGANVVFSMTSAGLTFGSTIDDTAVGAGFLSIAGSQTVTFDAAVGGMAPLAALFDTSAGSTTDVDTGTISTTGDQDYGGTVVVGAGIAGTTLTSGRSINFESGASLTTSNAGVNLEANTAGTALANVSGISIDNATITSTGSGNLVLQGDGGNDPTTGGHTGVIVLGGSKVQATGSGSITLTGAGGQGTGSDFGVDIQDSGTEVAAASGGITIAGTGTGSGGNGINLSGGGMVLATGSGAISLTGTASGSTAAITFTPSGSPGLLQSGSGTVTLTGDVIDLATRSGNPTITSTGGSALLFQPNIAGRPIILGGSDTAGSLVYSDTDNAAIAQGGSTGFGHITIGSATGSGTISTADNVTFAVSATVQSPNNTSSGITVGNTLNAGANTLTVDSGSTIATTGTGLLHAGTLALQSDGAIGSAGTPLAIAAGTLTADSSAGNGAQFLSETGTVQLSAGNALNAGSGIITLDAGTFQLTGSVSAASLSVNAATLSGSGSINGSLVVNSGGTVSPGTSTTPGLLTITGNYTQNAGATLDLKLGGATTAGTDYDQLVVAGTASLGGTVSVTAINGFTPAAGASFDVLTFASSSGDFASQSGFLFGGVFLAEMFSSSSLDLEAFTSPIVVTNGTDSHVNGQLSLREAVNAANQGSRLGVDITIEFAIGLAGQFLTFTQGEMEIGQGGAGTGTITINAGNPFVPLTISGNGADRVFQIDAGVQASLIGLYIQGGTSSTSGGAILNNGTLTLTGDFIVGNSATQDGGAIASSGSLTVTGTHFLNNGAALAGGAIESSGTLTITGSTFTTNAVDGATGEGGGAVAITAGSASITQSNFTSNTIIAGAVSGADDAGGAIVTLVTGSIIEFNRFSGNTDARKNHGNTVAIVTPGTANVDDNWWDSNGGPGTNDVVTGGGGSFSPQAVDDFLQLIVRANPFTINVGQSTTVTASFTLDTAGNTIAASNLGVLANLLASFGGNTLPGSSLTGTPTLIHNGQASVTYQAGQVGGGDTVTATVDGVTAFTTITVQQPPSITSAANFTFTFASNQSFKVMTAGFPFPTITETGEPLPIGITFHDNQDGTATISGTPAPTTGSYVFTITVHNGIGADATQTFTLTVIGPPVFTTGTPPAFMVGRAQSSPIATTPGLPLPTKLTERGKLPAGVQFKLGSNGAAQLTGKPKTGAGGDYPITLTASNGIFQSTQSFTLIVNQAPAILGPASATLALDQSPLKGAVVIKTTGFPFPTLSLSSTSGPLPPGVNLVENNNTWMLTGMPTSTGTFPVQLVASNSVGMSTAFTITLKVVQPPTFGSLDTTHFQVGQLHTLSITTSPGNPAKTTVTETGKLPAGLSFASGPGGTATITGIPKAGTGGDYPITLLASNGVWTTPQKYTLIVDQAPAILGPASATLALDQSPLKGAIILKTAGFPFPTLSLSNTSGPLPPGVNLVESNNTWMLTGMPTSTGTFAVQLVASNSVGTSAAFTITLKVVLPPTFGSLDATAFQVGQLHTLSITTSPGNPAKTTVTETGKLPKGLSFASGPGGTATITGTPKAGTGGDYPITLLASNGVWTTRQAYTLIVDQSAAITSAAHTSFTIGQAGSFLIKTTGFPVPMITAVGMPSWLSLKDNLNGTATLSGLPPLGSNTSYTITLTAHYGTGQAVTQTFILKVNESPIITTGNSASFTPNVAGSFVIKTFRAPRRR